ncbi:MAG: fructose-bisphosphate aldolase class I, partial [Candidatus Eremiobacteraeota bacterium]|nr:fructose-bisphosphate aldolase class I [Candidatus Eremiobacteraeota bacterium]
MSSDLASVAKAMVAPGKGVLAADESTGTANKRFTPLNIPETEEMRRHYRDLLFTIPDFGSFFSGVILYDETIRQAGRSGKSFVDILGAQDSFPGIKLDTGVQPLALAKADEKITEGLDGLAKRVDEYVKLGAKFAKWRAVITIDEKTGIPTDACLHANAHALARYAAICQAGGLVPIVEPEVLMDGNASQSIETSFAVHERTLHHVFNELHRLGVKYEEMVLKPSMVIPGQKSGSKASVDEVAEGTLAVLLHTVPAAVAGIAFLSGGQDNVEATAHLNAINVLAKKKSAPWPITFS